MDVLLSKKAWKFLDSLDIKIQQKIKSTLKNLGKDPFSKSLDITKLKGRPGKVSPYRIRIGDYRAIYAIIENEILVERIFYRSGDKDYNL